MKRTYSVTASLLMAISAISATFATGCTGSRSGEPTAQQSEKIVQYTCSMHPEVVQNKPGDCPKCGMKLVEKK